LRIWRCWRQGTLTKRANDVTHHGRPSLKNAPRDILYPHADTE
jgi:hypothetical protein